MQTQNQQFAADLAALQFYIDAGVADISLDEAQDKFALKEEVSVLVAEKKSTGAGLDLHVQVEQAPAIPIGRNEAREEAERLAEQAVSLEDLQKNISEFDGLAIKRTAMNMVFADGNKDAKIMIVGEAPAAEDDREGKPFMGVEGQLLDRILASIGLDRDQEDASSAVYMSHMLNWRPPGGRSPNQSEIEISLPFLRRHIELINPDVLLLLGGVPGKALLDRPESISRMRGKWFGFSTSKLGKEIPSIVTYHPAYLISTPLQKRSVWQDMQSISLKLSS
ncbi:MAG: uracil-DNA glycosylase [Micavibrio sp.]|nr:uracil-DNA glycosylase [Micavibrio sp.]